MLKLILIMFPSCIYISITLDSKPALQYFLKICITTSATNSPFIYVPCSTNHPHHPLNQKHLMCIAVSIACRRERYLFQRGSTNLSHSISLPLLFSVSISTQPRSLKQHTRSLPCFLLQRVSCTATARRRSGVVVVLLLSLSRVL